MGPACFGPAHRTNSMCGILPSSHRSPLISHNLQVLFCLRAPHIQFPETFFSPSPQQAGSFSSFRGQLKYCLFVESLLNTSPKNDFPHYSLSKHPIFFLHRTSLITVYNYDHACLFSFWYVPFSLSTMLYEGRNCLCLIHHCVIGAWHVVDTQIIAEAVLKRNLIQQMFHSNSIYWVPNMPDTVLGAWN